jgi:hypothetical protein
VSGPSLRDSRVLIRAVRAYPLRETELFDHSPLRLAERCGLLFTSPRRSRCRHHDGGRGGVKDEEEWRGDTRSGSIDEATAQRVGR